MIEELSILPGIGAKTASRLAFYILDMPQEQVEELSQSIIDAKKNVKYCKKCFTLTDQDICPICASKDRDHKTIMVVENTKDMAAYEYVGEYKGKIDCDEIEKKIRNKYSDITWVCAEIKGTNLIIHVNENYNRTIKEQENSPYNIIANCDAQIDSIITRTGVGNVKKGDKVKKGDILLKYNVAEKELDLKLQKLQIQSSKLEIAEMEKELKKMKLD